ncbi:MAG: trypsin-like peptidase domain-containing protein, partial [Chthoniobacterales bacterium]
GFEFFLHPPGSEEKGDGPSTPPMEGSGFIIDSQGYILTNAHVLEGADTKSIVIRLKDGREFPGKVIGADSRTDIAVLKINATALPVAELGNSEQIKIGQFAFAMGAPFELPDSFTMGIISAKGRSHVTSSSNYEDFIQTDASINPGSSGGPLCDIEGRVIGVNALIHGINRGLGFAIPINLANKIAKELIQNGKIVRPGIGITISTLRDNAEFRPFAKGIEDGVVVDGVFSGSPALKNDIRPADVILSIDGTPLRKDSELQKYILNKKVGDTVELVIWRGGKKHSVKVIADALPDPLLPAAIEIAENKPKNKPASLTLEMLGIQLQELTPELRKKMKIQEKTGVLITAVHPEGKAERTDLEAADVILEINYLSIHNKEEMVQVLRHTNAEDGILMLIERKGEKTYRILK